ncbi:hypothetical protein STRCR_0238 [Streptococcus criceti HS-6]|uniref:Uncharacterized protein n=1 Tax=Streptococcus criceti HS-6 TaxID=873449 RepID=G5JNS5_STRCG|nr:hypothetical protein [Streptococcus criceti]EHI75394.1 hypothetical protein STRCR_0238 [Streptococcus criceti HS-6]
MAARDHQYIHDNVQSAVKDYFRPEFLNRIDETVVFRPLDDDNILEIIAAAGTSYTGTARN